MYLNLLFTSLSFVVIKGEELVMLSKTRTTSLLPYESYMDALILHFKVPFDQTFACFKFEVEEIQLSLLRCPMQRITIFLKYGSPPVINPDGSKFPKAFFNFSRPMENIEFNSTRGAAYVNITSPIGGSYFAAAFISYENPKFRVIIQKGLAPNCDTLLTSSLFVARVPKPIIAVHDVDTDVLLEPNTVRTYKFHVFDEIDSCKLFLKNIQLCDACIGLTIKVQLNRIPTNTSLYNIYLKKEDYTNRPFKLHIITNEDSWYYVSFFIDGKKGKDRSHFEFKIKYHYSPDNDTDVIFFQNKTKSVKKLYARSMLKDYHNQYVDHRVVYEQYDLIRKSHTDSFLYSFDLCTDFDALPLPINITNKDLVILKFHIALAVDTGGTLQFGLEFKPLVQKVPKNHTVIACLRNNGKEMPTWPDKCFYFEEENKAAIILSDAVKNSTIFVPFPEPGNWYASLKLFCGDCKPCVCLEPCKNIYTSCHKECERDANIDNWTSCIERCEQSVLNTTGCETCDCDGPCRKSKSFCNSSISFEVSSYPCVTGQCGINGQCMKMASEGFHYSVCYCVNNYKGWDCSDDSAANSKGLILLGLLLLVLSNLAFILTVYVAYKRHYYVESIVYFSVCFFSSFYHACDAGENIYSFCITRISVLQFSDFFCGLLSIWVTILAIAYLPKQLASVLHISGAIILAFITASDRKALWAFIIPFGICTAILIISWYCHYKKTGKRFPSNYYLFRCFPVGISIFLIGILIFAILQTKSNYIYLHSFWHVCMAISTIFLLPGKSFLPPPDPDDSQNDQIT